ncbi:MAG: hypothetical protein ACO3EE_08505 [Flavobacteriales bacterium]
MYASTNNLYNGNIGAMTTAISKFDNGAPQAMAYGYDQLNRIVSATAYGHTSISSSNDWLGLAQKAAYHETYSYDANGNILSLTRTDGAGAAMDNFTYKYAQVDNQTATVFKKNTNRLMAVEDAVTANAAKKLGDIQAGQVYDEQNVANNNYEYDGIGNLVKDAQEEIASIKWHVNGKVTSVTRTTGSIKPDLEFQYDAMGNRTVKIVKPRTINGVTDESKWEYSYYVRDASGNVMAIYNKKYTAAGNNGYKESYTLAEQDIYGSSRLGTYTPVDNVIASRDVYGTIDATTKKINIISVYKIMINYAFNTRN